MSAHPPLRWRPFWLTVGWLAVSLLIWLTVTPSPPIKIDIINGDKLGHLLGYALLMGWFAQIYRGRGRTAVGIGLIAMGVALEFVQGAGGARKFEYLDMAANSLGVLSAWAAASVARMDRVLVWLEARIP